jgi:hypothetical protein
MEDPKGGEITPSSFHVLTSCKDATAPTEHCWKITALQSVEKHQKLMKAEGTASQRTKRDHDWAVGMSMAIGHTRSLREGEPINLHSP